MFFFFVLHVYPKFVSCVAYRQQNAPYIPITRPTHHSLQKLAVASETGGGGGRGARASHPLFRERRQTPQFRASVTSHAMNRLINASKEAMYLHVVQ